MTDAMMTVTRTRRRTAIVLGVLALAATVALGLMVTVVTHGQAPIVDTAWMALVFGPASPWIVPSLFLHELGFGLPAFLLATAVGGALFLWKRPWGAVYFLAVSIVSTAAVEVLKNSFARPRPSLALVDTGFGSYPSGHSARAAMLAVTLGILLPRVWVWILGAAYTLAMMFSRTQLGAHWLTDTVGGAFTGAAVALLGFAVIARQLQAEGARAHPPPWRR
jgi:undecaprenyl-diphosphatase